MILFFLSGLRVLCGAMTFLQQTQKGSRNLSAREVRTAGDRPAHPAGFADEEVRREEVDRETGRQVNRKSGDGIHRTSLN